VTGAKTVWRVPLSHFGAVDLGAVRGLRLDGYASNTEIVLSQIAATGLRGVACEAAPVATVRLELPDPNMGTAAAQWDFDNYTYVSSGALGAPNNRSNAVLAVLAALVQPAAGSFTGSLGITGRPYALSSPTSGTGAGDRIKLHSKVAFNGPHSYTMRTYLPLAQNTRGGEKWVAASFLNCTSCTPDPKGYKPELDFECHYADFDDGGISLRMTLNARSSQIVCQTHFQDGSPDGYAAVPMLVEGDAWHVFKVTTSDPNTSGYYAIAFEIDGVSVQWPSAAPGRYVDAVDTSSSDWTSKSVLYGSTSTPFEVILSLEHVNWSGSQLSTGYQTAYFDWVTVD
jgi:hypothetical protein